MATKKNWRDKVSEVEEKIHTITPEWEGKLGKGKILIPNVRDIERLINQTKKGELLTNDIIRETLPKEKEVKLTAAIPTGVYLKNVALAAEEERGFGKKNITPYWRVIKSDGSINIKFPISTEILVEILESEGHKIELRKGNKSPKVSGYEKRLKHFNLE